MSEEFRQSTQRLVTLLGVAHPLIQAGMAGGVTTPELVASVSNAGALGTLGAGYMPAEHIRSAIMEIRERTDRPFAVNLFIPEPLYQIPDRTEQAQQVLARYRRELGLTDTSTAPPSVNPADYALQFDEQLQALLEARVRIFSFTFGVPQPKQMAMLQASGMLLIGTATTVAEAALLEQAGVHAIVAQGGEAGGHRGTFLQTSGSALIGTMALVPQIVDSVRLPVIAAGGVMDGRGVAAALALGAAGAQLGTAFLACSESGAHPIYKNAVLHSRDDSTVLTAAFSGKPARALNNRFIREMLPYEQEFPPYPVQNTLTRDIRQQAASSGQPELMSLYAGQASALSTERSAAQVVASVIAGAQDAAQRAAAALK